ncbi:MULTISPECIES: hypothetical protein [unclassified Thiocapsa]|uniref:hypothetical protein n=1 Tax=unclassified Thiocapsa TaxID=2641286 RepID=UPI0035B1D55C
MADTLCLMVCSHFCRDVETALAGLGEGGVRVQAYPAVCTLRPGQCNLAEARETPPPEGCDGVLVLLGCETETRAAPPDPRVLLDTGNDAAALGALEAMARYLGLPCRSRYVGLDYLKLFLSGAIAKWRNLAVEAKTRDVLAQANRKVADDAMAFDLLVRLSHITDEEATIAAIQELFAMLFGCTNLVYGQVEEGRVKEIFAAEERPRDRVDLQQALGALHEGYLIMPSGSGFVLRIDYRDAVLGLMLVREIPFPAYRDQYLNLGLAISNLCGLAISNARTFVKLQETEQNLRREREINARLFQQIRALADTDPLTELLNRRRDGPGHSNPRFAGRHGRHRRMSMMIRIQAHALAQADEPHARRQGIGPLALVPTLALMIAAPAPSADPEVAVVLYQDLIEVAPGEFQVRGLSLSAAFGPTANASVTTISDPEGQVIMGFTSAVAGPDVRANSLPKVTVPEGWTVETQVGQSVTPPP